MKHFRLILTATRIFVTLLLVADVVFMVQLYNSIKKRYLDDVEQSLRRADQIELVDRIVDAGLADENGVVSFQLGLKKSDADTAATAEGLPTDDYSQGYRRMDTQLISVLNRYLHSYYGDYIDEPDLRNMEKAFRRDLNFSGYYPETVVIVGPDGCFERDAGLWEIEYRVDDDIVYQAYISPLTRNIFNEMSGVILTSTLIFLVLTAGFWYLLHVIDRQRSIEEMKDDFVNNMTHELKTPIAIAYAANDALLQYPDPADETRTRKYLTAATEQLSKLTGLVESILAMSMEKRKNMTMAKEHIMLLPFLTAIADSRRLGAHKPCDISVDCAADAALEADPTHLSNVIGNLIDNSIKYSGETVRIDIQADANTLSVADNGIGIPPESLPEIFNKFYRVPQSRNSVVRGYGIGLFYVKTIVEKHGWAIAVDSRQGQGTVFTIKFTAV